MRWLSFHRSKPYQVTPITHLSIGIITPVEPALTIELALRDRHWRWYLFTWTLTIVFCWHSTGEGTDPWSGKAWSGPCLRAFGIHGFTAFRWTQPDERAL